MKKRCFDQKLALLREKSLAFASVLSMAGKRPHEKSDGTVLFCIGDCMMGTASQVGKYASFQNFIVKTLRQLGYPVIFRSEHNTSQKFPIVGHQTSFAGANRIRIKYCSQLNIHIHRDLMAAENMADIAACELLGLGRPSYLRKAVSQAV